MSRPTKARRRRMRTRIRRARQYLEMVDALERRYGTDMPYQEALARQHELAERHRQIVDAYVAQRVTRLEAISALEAITGIRKT